MDVNYVNNQACYLAGSRVKGHDGKPELQVIISYNQPKDSVETYRRRWQIETMFKAMKSAGFNMEDTPHRPGNGQQIVADGDDSVRVVLQHR